MYQNYVSNVHAQRDWWLITWWQLHKTGAFYTIQIVYIDLDHGLHLQSKMHRIPIVVTFPSSCYTFVVLQTFQKSYNIWGQFIRAWFDVLKLCHLQKLMHQCPISLMQASCHLFLSILVGTWSVRLTNMSFLWHCECIGEILRNTFNIETWRAVHPSREVPWCCRFHHNGNTLKRCTLLSIFNFFSILMFWSFDEFKKQNSLNFWSSSYRAYIFY